MFQIESTAQQFPFDRPDRRIPHLQVWQWEEKFKIQLSVAKEARAKHKVLVI